MVSILRILAHNLEKGSRTRPPTEDVRFPSGYRGQLAHDPGLCTGCRTCAYVCAPGAITFDVGHTGFIVWHYFAGQCTFCGRCVEYCPTQALALEERPPSVTHDPAQHRLAHRVAYRPCARCGELFIPLPQPVLARLYGQPASPHVVALNALCDKCRRRAISEHMMENMR